MFPTYTLSVSVSIERGVVNYWNGITSVGKGGDEHGGNGWDNGEDEKCEGKERLSENRYFLIQIKLLNFVEF